MIGAYPIQSLEEAHSLGKGVEFLEEVWVGYEEETGIISFGDIHIHTDPSFLFDNLADQEARQEFLLIKTGQFYYDAEGKYVGEYKDGKKHGQGTWFHPQRQKYIGEWRDNKRHGQGTEIDIPRYTNGCIYIGEWKDNEQHGQGTSIDTEPSEGFEHVGDYKDGKMHGQGTSTYASGDKYVGEFKDDKRHGQGTFTGADGHKYVGEFKDGKPWEGIEYALSDKVRRTISSGKWCDGCEPTAEQLAIVRETNPSRIAATDETLQIHGGTYTGEVVNGRPHGQGTLTDTDGSKYVGEWKDDKRHGQGIQTWTNGAKYFGEWKDDKRHGQGTRFWNDPNDTGRDSLFAVFPFDEAFYVGEWENGDWCGQGTFIDIDGSKYVGEWDAGFQHGQGTFIDIDGSKYVGEWKDDKRHGQGTKTYPDGGKYIGEWKDDERWKGALHDREGDVLETYSEGKPR
ncbi:MAG: MORN motif precursor [Bacteroidetes Order II. Incertae sedis bacterium]|nr:MORN motif precursor [Bacteroidetes Order II. bacterium]